jgi:uncharacterized protein (TIGR02118 family)
MNGSSTMSMKIVVLYPRPVDPAAFEAAYHGEHMPLMRRLLGPETALPTFRAVQGSTEAPFYRMAEIHFRDRAALSEFARSERAQIGRASSEKVSTGGPPIVFVVEADAAP